MYAGVPLRTSAPSISPASTGEAEIGEQHLAARVEHDVGRLQIAMQDALLVRGREPGAQLAGDLERLVGGKPPDAPQQRAEVLAVDVLHREEVQAFHFAEIVDAADVRMRHLARDAHLVAETLQRLLVVRDRLRAGT